MKEDMKRHSNAASCMRLLDTWEGRDIQGAGRLKEGSRRMQWELKGNLEGDIAKIFDTKCSPQQIVR